MRSRVLAYLLPAACLLYAQQPAAVETKDRCRIEGRVVNAITAEPMSDVDLTLRALPPGTDGQKIVSDAEGRFAFEGMQPGSYTLSAERFWQAYGGRAVGGSGTPLTLAEGQVLKDIEFRLTPLGVINGVVVDSEDKPMPKVTVTAMAAGGSSMGYEVPRFRETTNRAGEFRFAGLTPGSYLLAAVAPVAPPAPPGKRNKREEQPLVTYYPSGIDEVEAVPLKVTPGQELSGLRITLRKGLLFHVQGTVVTSSPDLPFSDVSLLLAQRVPVPPSASPAPAGPPSGGRSPAPDGSFDLVNVQPGSYELRAALKADVRVQVLRRWDGSNVEEITGLVLLGRVSVNVTDTDVTGVMLRIGKPLQLQGTLRMEGQDEADFTKALVQLRPVDSFYGNLSAATVGTGNAFTMEDVAQDKHVVVVWGLPGRAYVKSIRLGSQEAMDSGLDLTNMETAPPLDILISPNGATVEGTVKQDEDQPASGARVSLVPDPAQPELAARLKSTMVTSDGRFSLTGVAPGEYRLYAYRLPRLGVLIDMGFFKPFESKAVKVTVAEGERKQVDLTVLMPPEAR